MLLIFFLSEKLFFKLCKCFSCLVNFTVAIVGHRLKVCISNRTGSNKLKQLVFLLLSKLDNTPLLCNQL